MRAQPPRRVVANTAPLPTQPAYTPPPVQAASERTLKARLLDVDRAHDRVRADVRGRPTVYSVANGSLLRGFRKGDLVLLRVRGATVVDVRLAVLTAEVLRSDERSALLTFLRSL